MPDKFTTMTPELYRYAVEHSSRDPVLERLAAETEALGGVAIMQMAADQGALTTLVVRAIGARRALELGTFTGYGSICIARGLPQDGHLITCEIDEGYAEIARRYFGEAGLDDRIELRMGPAIETLAAIDAGETFDYAFIDADKTSYGEYYEEALRLLRPGGLMMIDNVFRGGDVVDPAADDDGSRVVRELNDRIAADERVEAAMVGISDGITFALKRPAGSAR